MIWGTISDLPESGFEELKLLNGFTGNRLKYLLLDEKERAAVGIHSVKQAKCI